MEPRAAPFKRSWKNPSIEFLCGGNSLDCTWKAPAPHPKRLPGPRLTKAAADTNLRGEPKKRIPLAQRQRLPKNPAGLRRLHGADPVHPHRRGGELSGPFPMVFPGLPPWEPALGLGAENLPPQDHHASSLGAGAL